MVTLKIRIESILILELYKNTKSTMVVLHQRHAGFQQMLSDFVSYKNYKHQSGSFSLISYMCCLWSFPLLGVCVLKGT